jgi:hypothetical protein
MEVAVRARQIKDIRVKKKPEFLRLFYLLKISCSGRGLGFTASESAVIFAAPLEQVLQ